ncbi:MAG: serine/threonine-protein kinase, partial [Woeseiaceae bacterium]
MRILNEGARLADRYTLNRRLGTGGMSEVWLAADRSADATIALKFLAGESAGDARQKELLQREWRIGSRLMHPNIIRVFEFHDDPDGAYFGLQFVGETDIGALTGSDPAASMRPVGLIADALRYAHGKDVVHRDIKAANILLDSRGVPYLVDFGVAAMQGSSDVAGSGSDIAMSPEQRAGGAASPADDIFSLGVLMHELLTGVPPVDLADGDGLASMQDGTPIPGALRELLSNMLDANPSARPTAESVAGRLVEAGFPAGAAPARFVSGESAAAEVLESVEPVPGFKRQSAVRELSSESSSLSSSQLSADKSGISPRLLYGGLGAALILFLGVIFVLPNLVDRDRPPPATQTIGNVEESAEPLPESLTVDEEVPVSLPTGDTSFSENLADTGGTKADTDEALGDLLSQLERLRYRAIDRWGGQDYLDAVDVYEEGDQAYVDRN